ncbi:MAG: acyltransferase [Candidatus Sumerlaeia bacterium]|nr:acyltransferase [Candidatus Sumerlaeia bacterium]
MKRILRALLRIPPGCGIGFGARWRVGQLVGFNSGVPWPVHWTSTVHWPRRVRLGAETFPGDSPHCYINAMNGIVVGDRTNIGPGAGLVSANHDPADNKRYLPAPPIRIGRDCWIGMNAVVLPGVTLGDRTVVGAGAVVTKSFPEGDCVVAGNPARVVKRLGPTPPTRPTRA